MARSVPCPKDTDPFADRRLYPRVSVALPAFVQIGSERHSVHLVDVSPGGAKLSCSMRLAAGTPITLDCGTLARSAVVRWLNGDMVGIRFDSELEGREMTALVNRSNALQALIKTRA